MARTNFDLSILLKQQSTFSRKQLLSFIVRLSVPGILAEISNTLMQYIDAAMVGQLGAEAAAAIGLVASSSWLLAGFCHAFSFGFTVQVAQAVGAGERQKAKNVLRQSLIVCGLVSLLFAIIGALISNPLPVWLGGGKSIHEDAAFYFLVFALSLPAYETVFLLGGMLQASGDMKTPGIMNMLMCVLDVVFNAFYIFGLKLGVKGAALGSLNAALVTVILIARAALVKSPYLRLINSRRDDNSDMCDNLTWDYRLKADNDRSTKRSPQWKLDRECIRHALKISMPIAGERVAMSGAMVATTRIIAPLGTVSIAANSFAITAESLCYMPGYGIQAAATTLVGQSIGAKRGDMAKRFAWFTVIAGMVTMGTIGLLMYAICPAIFAFLTPVKAVQNLATQVLRFELFAEPLFAASIVASGALRGKGDTLVPSVMNFASIWGVRIVLTILLVPSLALSGAWIAMSAELCFRGIIFLIRLSRTKWKNMVAQ